MARLGSIIESVYASGAASKSKDPGMKNAAHKEHPNVLRDDRLDFPSLDGTSSSTSFDFSNFDADSSVSSPRDGSCISEEKISSSTSRVSPLGWSLKHEKIPLAAPPKAMWEEKREKRETDASEVEMMKERFARLLLGEDMSGGSRGVSTALAISNAITNLSASIFGELWRLEPLSFEKKNMWRREMEWMLSVTDHVVELVPTWQSYPDGSSVEVMVSNPRADLHINLPALRKLDMMLLECLDGFSNTEFWYVDQGLAVAEESGTPRTSLPRQEEKWWLPTPRVPPNGLSLDSKKRLLHQKESVNQILKAAMAINAQVLSEMDVPEVYWEALPKNGRSSLGEGFYRCLAFEHFNPDAFLAAIDLSSEHSALEIANRLEAAIHAWQRKMKFQKQVHSTSKDGKSISKSSSWSGLMKDLVGDGDRREILIGRAESLLLCLKQKFPGLSQTLLDIHKIQYNKDVGQSILESYSRVLECLAFSIVSRIDDVLHMDEMTRNSNASVDVILQVCPTPLKKRASISGVPPDLRLSADFLRSEPELNSPKFDRPRKPPPIDVHGFSYARHLENGNSLHSPPGRD